MAYSKFNLKEVKEKFDIHLIEDQHLFAPNKIPPVSISDYLKTTLEQFSPLALSINTEKSRSEWIIAPILAALRQATGNQISLFSGTRFNVDEALDLEGVCDYMISLSPEQFYISKPIIAVVEAKKENIIQGLGQCIATLYAAQLYNQREGQPLPAVYGIVTTGTTWKFIKLENNQAYIDIDEYYVKEIDLLMSILQHIVNTESPSSL